MKPWVVLKYGGTSVATAATWGSIARRIQQLLPTNRVWLVVSAVSKVTNALLLCLEQALTPSLDPEAQAAFAWISGAHAKLSADRGLTAGDYAPVAALLDDLKRLLDGIVLTQEVSPKLRARVAAFGELLSSQLGVAYLRRQGGCAGTMRVDSRSLLTSVVDESRPLTESDVYLEADVRPSIQVDRANAAAQGGDVVICQGFIAATPTGATCLLGRGGSDTSAALFAALVGAARLEIWTGGWAAGGVAQLCLECMGLLVQSARGTSTPQARRRRMGWAVNTAASTVDALLCSEMMDGMMKGRAIRTGAV